MIVSECRFEFAAPVPDSQPLELPPRCAELVPPEVRVSSRPYAAPAKFTGLSRGPALVCGLLLLFPLREAAEAEEVVVDRDLPWISPLWLVGKLKFSDGKGRLLSSSTARSTLDLLGDLDFDLAVAPPSDKVSSCSLYFAAASCRSASLVETAYSSLSASSIVSVP
jgi:hypothetical protein